MKKFYISIVCIISFFILTAATVVSLQPLENRNGVGTSGSGFTATEYGDGSFHKTVLKCSSKSVSMDDVSGASTSGYCTLYNFPKGSVEILGALVKMTTARVSTGIASNADGDVGVGTATCDTTSTLSSTEQDIVPTTSIAQMVSGSTTTKAQKAAVSFHDGTTTAKKAYLNLLFDDADSSADDAVTLTGTVTIYWINQGTY